jgi:hypothetical protein
MSVNCLSSHNEQTGEPKDSNHTARVKESNRKLVENERCDL